MNISRLLTVGAVLSIAGWSPAKDWSVADCGGDVNAAVVRVAESGGGRVIVPKGEWPTPSVKLVSHVELHLEEGARLVASTNRNDYQYLHLPYCEGDLMAVVTAVGQEDVSITGKGEIYGSGEGWPHPTGYDGNQEGLRPRGLVFANCKNVRLADFTIRELPCWGIVIKNCDGVLAQRIRVDSHCNANNDGFDVEARNVLIEDCDVDTGDDSFCLKSNDPGFVMENVTIRRCVGRSNCNAFKIGTASHGIIRHIRFEDCRAEAPSRDFLSRVHSPRMAKFGEEWFRHNRIHLWAGGPDHLAGMSGIAIECVDGGEVSDVVCNGFDIRGMMSPIFVRGGTRKGRSCGTPPGNIYVLRDIVISNVTAEAESYVANSITGVRGCRPKNVRLENVELVCKAGSFKLPAGAVPEREGCYPEANCLGTLPTKGLYLRHVDGAVLKNVTVKGADGKAIVCDDVMGLKRESSSDVTSYINNTASAAVSAEMMALWPEGKTPSFQKHQKTPCLVWYAPKELKTRSILIAVSGGAYKGSGLEGFEVAPIRDYMLAKGMTVVTMAYRTPRPEGLDKHVTAWQDAQRTIRLVRDLAKRRGLDPDSIGFTGCSAGGHLTMLAAVSSMTRTYEPVDDLDGLPCNVNWAIPVYPAYLLADGVDCPNVRRGNDLADGFVSELAFDAATPPMCFFHGDKDDWSAMGSARAYHRLRTMGLPAELHVLALEDHCFQSNPRPGTSADMWLDVAWAWLVSMDVVTGHPMSWKGDWTSILPIRGRKPLSAVADFEPDAWRLVGWGSAVMMSARDRLLALKGTWSDFVLDFEYKADEKSAADAIVRIQDVKDWSRGSCVAKLPTAEQDPGRWHRVTIYVRGNHLKTVADGRTTVDSQVDSSGNGVSSSGRIGFRATEGVCFRNLRVRNL